MFFLELGDIVDVLVDDDVQTVGRLVGGHVLGGKDLRHDCGECVDCSGADGLVRRIGWRGFYTVAKINQRSTRLKRKDRYSRPRVGEEAKKKKKSSCSNSEIRGGL
jgi:hypothetical protein